MQKGFFCTNTSIYYTADAGATWKLSYTNPNIQLVAVKIEGNNVYATTCGTNLILKLDISEILSSLAKNYTNQNAISIYPNPANDLITIVSDENEKLIRATITDQLGRLVKSVDLTDIKIIDTKELNSGLYQLETASDKRTYVNKIIITKE
jgi:Secretion system C-terminal sorting domain